MVDGKGIVLIDDDQTYIDIVRRLLEEKGLKPILGFLPSEFQRVDDYKWVITGSQYDAILIDQRLDDLSGVPYTGFDVAEYLRGLSSELPIYILTAFPGDIEDRENAGDVEDVIAKDDLAENTSKYVARILRSVSRYEEALSEKSKELGDLIDKKIGGVLSASEAERLSELRLTIERSGPDTRPGGPQSSHQEPGEGESVESRLLNQIINKLEDMSGS